MSDSTAVVAGHGIAGAAVLGTLIGWLPAVAAVFGILWYAVCIYESRTVQELLGRPRQRRRTDRHHQEPEPL